MNQPFRYYLRVRYGECDAQHVVFNARFGDYVDLACSEYLRAAFPGRDVFDGTFEFQLVRQLTEWTGPARFDEVLEISVQVIRLGTSSFTMQFDLRRAGRTDVIAVCETVYVMVDRTTWAKRPMTVEERQRLETGAAGQLVDHAGYLGGHATAAAGH